MMKSILTLAACAAMPLVVACSSGGDNQASAETVSNIASKLPALSGQHVWKVDRGASKLEFRAEHNGTVFTGNFGTFDAAINLDLADPSTGEIQAVIDLSSVDAKDDDRNANLPSKAWFDVKSFPLATYRSTDISGSPEDGYSADGILSLKGIERPVVLKFKVTAEDKTAKAIGTARFSRSDFNVGTGSDFATEEWVKFPIEVLVSVTAAR